MSLGPEAAAVVTKAVSQMPSPPMQEVGIFAAGKFIFRAQSLVDIDEVVSEQFVFSPRDSASFKLLLSPRPSSHRYLYVALENSVARQV